MKRLLAVPATLVAAHVLAAAIPWKSFEVELAARASHEECQHIDAAAERRYSWKADAPVDFNIHFHEGDKATYPVKREGMRADGGSFRPKAAQDYCWMWTARDKAVKLEGRVEAPEAGAAPK